MMIALALLAVLLLAAPASAQTFGSPHFDTGYEVSKASDGSTSTAYLGKCQPNNALGNCGARPLTPPTSDGWILGRDLGSVKTLTGLHAIFYGAAYRPNSVTVQGSAHDTPANADGSNLTGWTTLGTLPSGVDVSVNLSGSYRHVRLLMSEAPGASGCGFSSCEYMPGVAEFSVDTTTGGGGGGGSSQPASVGPWCEGCTTVTVTGASVANAMGCYGPGAPSTYYGGQCGNQVWQPWWALLNLFRPRVTFINRAVPGVGTDITWSGLNTPPWSSQIAPAIADGGGILVEIGTNDCAVGRSATDAAAAIATGIDLMLAAGRPVALLETMPRASQGNATHQACFTALRGLVQQIARERPSLRFCPMHEAIRDHGSADPNAPALATAPDGTHLAQGAQIKVGMDLMPRCLDWAHRMPGS